jgi:putative peptidoglycan lipid II flippase
LVAVFVNVVLNLILIWFMGTGGLALSTAICSYLQVIILIVVLRRRLGHSILDGLLVTFMKTVVAAAFMWLVAAAIMTLMKNLPDGRFSDILRLAVVVPVAAGVYLLAAKSLHIEMLSLLTGAKAKR